MASERLPTSDRPAVVDGRYRVLDSIASGGMGEVYAALDEASGQKVAIKRLRRSSLERRSVLEHFRTEFRALSALEHPRIIEVYDYGLDGDLPYFSMELLDGQDLRALAPLPYAEACKYLRDVASSIALLHARGLLHRDLSPRNVRRTGDGRCKLIDFGTMAPFGDPPNVAGTAPLLPPEALRGDALDQRADLYSLGALAYWLLTGHHAYDAQTFDDLKRCWLEPPPRMRGHDPAIPATLDDLVLSLLHLDPMGRPKSAGEVIELLGSLAEPGTDDSLEVARSYLVRTALVGRGEQQAQVERRLGRVEHGRGSALLIHGLAGEGKSRLLQDSVVNAKTHGLLALSQGARTLGGDRALAHRLAAQLIAAAPGLARQSMAEDRSVLERFLEEPSTAVDLDVLLQPALARWFERVARRRPLFIGVDDLDQADGFSAAFIAALALNAGATPLVLLATSGRDAGAVKSAAYQAFADAAQHVTLSALDEAGTLELVTSSFGVVPNTRQVATWLYRNARGNPAMSIELIRHLAERNVVSYARGSWSLPDIPITEQVPQELHRALSLRLSTLGEHARLLAELLACCGEGAERSLLERASALPTALASATLEELVDAGLLDSNGASRDSEVSGVSGTLYTFKLEAAAQAFLPQDDPRKLRSRHAALARVLLEARGDDYRRLRGAWHLSHTDSELAGARILAEVGPRLVRSATGKERAAQAMERALEIFERHGEPLAARLELSAHLVNLGYLWNPLLNRRYADETLEALYRVSGLERATRWTRWLPASLAAPLSLLLVQLTRLFKPRAQRPPALVQSLVCFCRALVATAAVRAFAIDAKGAQALRPMTVTLARARMPGGSASAAFAAALTMQPEGNEHEVSQALDATAESVRALNLRLTPGMTSEDVDELLVGSLLMRSMYQCYRCGRGGLDFADQLEARGTTLAIVAAERIRMVYYSVRGRREEAEASRRLIELHGIQDGSIWQVRAFSLPIEGLAGAIYGDVVTTRRALDHLEKAVPTEPALATMRDLVRCGYHYARGEYASAVESGKAFIERHPPNTIAGWAVAYALTGRALLELDRDEDALALCRRGWDAVRAEDRKFFSMYMPLQAVLAIAEGVCGDADQSKQLFDQMDEQLLADDELTVLALIYEYRVRLAQKLDDRTALHASLQRMRELAHASGSPLLVAHVDRFAALASRTNHGTDRPDAADPISMSRTEVETALSNPPGDDPITQVLEQVSERERRAQHALHMIAQGVGALRGYMIVPGEDQPELVARLSPRDPPEALEQAMIDFLLQAEAGKQQHVRIESGEGDEASRYLLVLLPGTRGSSAVVALEEDGEPLTELRQGLMQQVGQGLA